MGNQALQVMRFETRDRNRVVRRRPAALKDLHDAPFFGRQLRQQVL
jgi:hypothetical protein